MESIGQPINKDYHLEGSQNPEIRVVDELLRLAEIRIRELEKRVSYLEGSSRAQYLEVVSSP